MAHGSDAVLSLNGQDLSAYIKNTTWSYKRKLHENTCYGSNGETFEPGLFSGTLAVELKFDSTDTTGPRAVILAAQAGAAAVALLLKEEGTGIGKPQVSANVWVEDYVESVPVGDIITASCNLVINGVATTTDQA